MQPLPHRYEVRLRGAPAGSATVSLAGAPDIEAAPPADFGGPGDAWGPEHLLLAAVETCFLFTLRAVAQASKIVFSALELTAVGTVDRKDGALRFTEIVLRPRVTVRPAPTASGRSGSSRRARRRAWCPRRSRRPSGSSRRSSSADRRGRDRASRPGILQPLQPRLRPRRGGGARRPGGRPGLQRRADDRPDAGRRRSGGRSSCCSPSWACRPTPATTCSTSAPCSTASRTRCRRVVAASREPGRWSRSSGCRSRSTTCSSTARRWSRAGAVLGVVPKTYLPNYREFYEARQFTPADVGRPRRDRRWRPARRCRSAAASSSRLEDQPLLRPSTSRSARTSGRRSRRRPTRRWPARPSCSTSRRPTSPSARPTIRHDLVAGQSARCLAAYLYSAAGPGESTTDLAWDGHALIYENGEPAGRVAALRRRAAARLRRDRPGAAQPGADAPDHASARPPRLEQDASCGASARSGFPLDAARAEAGCCSSASYERFPYVPADPPRATSAAPRSTRSRCRAWPSGCAFTGIQQVVIGVSGGLDSTHALLVCAQAMDRLGCPRDNILAYTMPGFATSAPDARPGPRA